MSTRQTQWSSVIDPDGGTLLIRGVTGANHRNTKAPCQDASLAAVRYYKGYPYTLLAVADGHGAARYTHSHIGAHFAVEAVSESATRWILSAVDCLEGEPEQWYENSRRSFEENFPRWLRENWLARVKRHAGEGNETAYGTTVALAIVFQGRVFAGVIGDSTILILRETDSTEPDLFTDTMPAASLGLSTASLASADAVSRWSTRVMALDDARLIAAVTDGFTDSIANLRETLFALRNRIQQQGVAWLWDKWPDFLERLTEDGVGDDIATVLYLPASPITTKTETET